jgi:hypothetical protein
MKKNVNSMTAGVHIPALALSELTDRTCSSLPSWGGSASLCGDRQLAGTVGIHGVMLNIAAAAGDDI